MKTIKDQVHSYLFHLCQSLYRRRWTNNPNNHSIKLATQTTSALVFILPEK